MYQKRGPGYGKKINIIEPCHVEDIIPRFLIAFSIWLQLIAVWRTGCILVTTKKRNIARIIVTLYRGEKKVKEEKKKSLPVW